MGHKRQLERRRAHTQRAAASGDLNELRHRFSQSPRAVVADLALALQRAEARHPDLLDLAADVSASRRRDGAFAEAGRVLDAAGPVTPLLSVERGLLAFAAGDDDTLQHLVRSHEEVKRALGALAAITEAEPRRPSPAERSSPRAVQALTGLARMIAATARGDRGGLSRSLKEVPLELHQKLCVEDVHAACSLATLGARESGAARLAGSLSRSPLVRGDRARERLLAALMAEVAPATLDRGAFQGVSAASSARERRTVVEIHARREEGADPMAAALHAASVAGESLFVDPGEGSLVMGFVELGRGHTDAALRAFDAAIAGGADLVESLRGRWIALSHRASARDDARFDREAAVAAERLAHALRARPGAAPYAALAAVEAARGFSGAGDFVGTERAVQLAASVVLPGSLPDAVRAQLEVYSLRKGMRRGNEGLMTKLREMTAAMPELEAAWEARIELAALDGATREAVDALVLEAFDKTRSPMFAPDAREVAAGRARAASGPAAALVNEVLGWLERGDERVVSTAGTLDAALEEKLSLLKPGARHSARVAILVELGSDERWTEVAALLARRAREGTPEELSELLIAFAHIPAEPADRYFAASIRTLASAHLLPRPILEEALGAAVAMQHPQACQAALALLAPLLATSELTRWRRDVESVGRREAPARLVERCETVMRRVDKELQPGYSLLDTLFGSGDDGNPFPSNAEIDEIVRMLPPRERETFMQRTREIAMRGRGPSERDLVELAELLSSLMGRSSRKAR